MMKSFLVIILFLAGFPSAGFAEISFKAKITVTTDEKFIDVDIFLSNTGNEDALKVFPVISWQDGSQILDTMPYIAFGGANQWSCRFDIEENKKYVGTYPLFIHIQYRDVNQYPFSMAGVAPVSFGNTEVNRPVMVKLENMSEPEKTMSMKMTLNNYVSTRISGKCRLHSPIELEVMQPVREFSLGADEALEFEFDMENRGALPENRYKVYGVLEFEDDSGHATQIVAQTVTVSLDDKKGPVVGQVWGGIALIFALFLATLYFELRGRGD